MDTSPGYQVIFSGKLREGFTAEQVKQALGQRLKLPEATLARWFSGKPQLIKQTRSVEEAKKLATGLAAMGAVVRVQRGRHSPPATASVTKAPPAPSSPITVPPALPKFAPHPKGVRLTAALTLAAASEVFFLLLYLLMLLASSVGLVYYSLFTTWGAAITSFGPLALLLQALALLLGLVVLFLVAKPLRALTPQGEPGVSVSAEQEPELHAFVNDICERIQVPPPELVCITNSVNVELGYLRGPLGFLLNRCVLSIGAPLVASTDTSQLAALIAQSLQLFHSRKLSPRAAFLLRHSDGWLQRAIDEEDAIDQGLADLVTERSPLSIVVVPLQRLIALSRTVLGWRLRLSRRLNRQLFHRLVADADKVSLLFSGSTGFRHLLEQQRLLAFTAQAIQPELQQRWQTQGTLPDNLVQAMLLRGNSHPPSIHQQLRHQQEQQKLASHDPIPADSQRLHRVSRMKVAAAYPGHSAASKLFRNFDKLARSLTLRFYHHHLNLPITPNRLVPTNPADPQTQRQQQQIDAMMQRLYCDFIPLKLHHRIKMVSDYDDAMTQHRQAQQEGSTARAHAELAFKRYVETDQALIDVSTHELMYRADLWRQWGIEPAGRDGLDHIHHACREQEKELEEAATRLAHQLQPYIGRLASALALLAMPQAAAVKQATALHKEVQQLLVVLERIEQAAPQLRELRLHTTLLQTLLSYDGERRGKRHDRIQEQAGDIQRLLAGLGATLKTTPYPFSDSQRHKNLMGFALHHAYSDAGADGDADRGCDVVTQITQVERQILARLCAIALHVEKALKL